MDKDSLLSLSGEKFRLAALEITDMPEDSGRAINVFARFCRAEDNPCMEAGYLPVRLTQADLLCMQKDALNDLVNPGRKKWFWQKKGEPVNAQITAIFNDLNSHKKIPDLIALMGRVRVAYIQDMHAPKKIVKTVEEMSRR